MKYLFLILTLFIALSCSDNSQGVDNSCVVNSDCMTGKECFENNCVSVSGKCSETKLDGYCLDDKTCVNGECIAKICIPNPCIDEHRTICVDTENGTSYNCDCNENYHLDGESCLPDNLCVDVLCDGNSACNMNTGICDCNEGYELNSNQECVLIDLCAAVDCKENSTCNPENGNCECNEEFTLDSNQECVLINLCAVIDCKENATCNPTNGNCECNEGYSLDNNNDCIADDLCLNVNCEDNEHCSEGNCVCNDNSHIDLDENSPTKDKCVLNVKSVSCVDNSPDNSTPAIIEVEVSYDLVNNVWSEAVDCEWNCNDKYHDNNGLCVEDNSCDTNTCTEVNRTICSNLEGVDNYECLCVPGYVLENNQCVVVTYPCSNGHQDGYCTPDTDTCVRGECVTPAVGSPCDDNSDCETGFDCKLDSNFIYGYCTKNCTDDVECGTISVCSDWQGNDICLSSCNNNNDCANGLVCRQDNVCVPPCTANSQCQEYQYCENNTGLCENDSFGCDIFADTCSDGRSCYTFDEINTTACADTGSLHEKSLCINGNDCVEGLICVDVDLNSSLMSDVKCLPSCKPSEGVINNPSCANQYDTCVVNGSYGDIGYCELNQSIIPVGENCNSSNDCYPESICSMFYNHTDTAICLLACDTIDVTKIDTTTYVNDAICIQTNSTSFYWMDICSQTTDCLDENFVCKEVKNTSSYTENYCMPSPDGYDCSQPDVTSCDYLGENLGCYTWDETHGYCITAGTLPVGTECTSNSSCVPGSECWRIGAVGDPYLCTQLCDDNNLCSDGKTCDTNITARYGVCR